MSVEASSDDLDFRLPPFTRWSWASPSALAIWQPRIERVIKAATHVEWLSVLSNLYRAAIVSLSGDEIGRAAVDWFRAGLVAVPIRTRNRGVGGARPSTDFLVTRPEVVDTLDASAAKSSAEWVLGAPECCIDAARSTDPRPGLDSFSRLVAATGNLADHRDRVIKEWEPASNIAFRVRGLRAVPHVPCALDCVATGELWNALSELWDRHGYSVERAWLLELLSMSLEWSALHGIAEVKTPLFRMIYDCRATASKHVIRLDSGVASSTRGVRFPYAPPPRNLVTHSASFRRGIDAPLLSLRGPGTTSVAPVSTWLENGFSSMDAMGRCHSLVVEAVTVGLQARVGGVLDLGCGNGALLRRICAARDSALIPWGVDANAATVRHARELDAERADHYCIGDMFDPLTWPGPKRYTLGVLMLGRLIEREHLAATLARTLRAACEVIVLYVYPGYPLGSLASLAARADIALLPGGNEVAGVGEFGRSWV